MKTLVAYATGHGATEKYAKAIAARIAGDVAFVDLKHGQAPDLTGFEAVIVGTAIYYGQPTKAVKQFCAGHAETLKGKRLGLFICCLNLDQADQMMKTAFPSELQEAAVATGVFGGELIMKKLSFGERLIARVVSKSGEDLSRYSEDPLAGFITAFEADRPQG